MVENINENTDFSKLTHDDLINVKKRFKPDHIVYIKAKCELEHREYARNKINDKFSKIKKIFFYRAFPPKADAPLAQALPRSPVQT